MHHLIHRLLSMSRVAPLALSLSLGALPLLADAQTLPEASPRLDAADQPAAASAPPAVMPTDSAGPSAEPPSDPVSAPVAAADAPADIAAATTTSGPPPPLKVIYSHTGLDQRVIKPVMDDLRVVHQKNRQDLVAAQVGQVALNVALVLLTRAPVFTARNLDQQGLSGVEPEGVQNKARLRNPALQQLPADLQRHAATWLDANEKTRGQRFTLPLIVNAATWKLIYNSLDPADNTYKLHFDAQIYKLRDKPSFITGYTRPGSACAFATDARPLADWAANDYQAVADAVPQAIAHCSEKFIAQLPQLLELE